jgi:hypothetical protein
MAGNKPVVLSRQPTRLDLWVYAGDSFPVSMIAPLNLAGYIVRAQARRDSSATAKFWDFSTLNGRITLVQVSSVPVKWQIAFAVNPTETRLVGDGLVWDLQLEAPDGDTRTWFYGEVRRKGDYTRA